MPRRSGRLLRTADRVLLGDRSMSTYETNAEEIRESDGAHYTLHDEPAYLGGEQYARCIHCDSEAVGEPEQVLHDEGCKLRRDWR